MASSAEAASSPGGSAPSSPPPPPSAPPPSEAGRERLPDRVVVLKLGGSSITVKSSFETLDADALDRVSAAVAGTADVQFLSDERRGGEGGGGDGDDDVGGDGAGDGHGRGVAFVIVHGAGSFGHHTAREYGLRGRSSPPPPPSSSRERPSRSDEADRRRAMTGLSRTRLSVTGLNRSVVSSLLSRGVNAVGLSPGMTVPGLGAHGGDERGGMTLLARAAADALVAGLVPVIHGDAALYGPRDAGILGGDALVEGLAARIGGALASALAAAAGGGGGSVGDDGGGDVEPPGRRRLTVVEAVFLTDVDGVFTSDPNLDEDAALIPEILVDGGTGRVLAENLNAGGSTHDHDVTGGLEAKLGAAARVARGGIEVKIVRCGSDDATRALRGEAVRRGTVVRRKD